MKQLFYILLFIPAFLCAQELKTISATKDMVNIRDGKKMKKNAWKISPDVSPDIYSTNNNKVTFYTDKDEITVFPEEGKPIDFIINLNGKKALTKVEYALTYLQKLQRAGVYNTYDNRQLPAFTYLAPNDENLQKLRRELKLDSIAGQGDEVLKIKNLMSWVHNNIRHDGNSDNPNIKNALGIIEVCHTENRGVNCRMMATVLNECYLAMHPVLHVR